MKKVFIVTLFILSACSAGTVYNIEIDLLSFIETPANDIDIIFPPSEQLNIYLLPGLEIDKTGSGPGIESAAGQEVTFAPLETDSFSIPSVILKIGIVIKNGSESEQITGDRISVYIGTPETENLYTDGIKIDLINVNTLGPGKSVELLQEYNILQNDSIFQILDSGKMKIAVGVYLTASSAFVPAEISLNRINISSSFLPIEFILQGE